MEAWPSTVPQSPSKIGVAENLNGLADDSENKNPVRIRTYPEEENALRINKVTLAQWQTLRGFYQTTVNDGMAPFTAPWLEDLGYDNHFCRFLSAPKATAISSGFWSITMSLEIISSVPLDAEGDVVY